MAERLEHTEGGNCQTCKAVATLRTCYVCGDEQWILDCGHMAQPTPIAAGHADGSDAHHDYCEDCATGGDESESQSEEG